MESVLILDTETTGVDDDAKVIEIGASYATVDGGAVQWLGAGQEFVNPQIPIPADSMSIHHITDVMVEGATNDPRVALIEACGKAHSAWDNDYQVPICDFYLAHNAEFDRRFLDPILPEDAVWICTYKVAMTLYPEAPNHKLGTLYYHFGLHELGEYTVPDVSGAHRADIDTQITASVFAYMYQCNDISLADMAKISSEPILLHKVGFGKHFGKLWSDVPKGYLKWIMENGDFDEDVLHTARTYFLGN